MKMKNVNHMTRREQQLANIYTAIILIVTILLIAAGVACSASEQSGTTDSATSALSSETQTIDASMVLPQDDVPAVTTLTVTEASGTTDSVPATWGDFTEGDTFTGTLSYYDVCYACCGKTDGITASGLHIWNGMEDPHVCSCNWLPLGTIVSIDGVEYTVADRGGSGLNAIGRIDIFVPAGHQAALNLGRTEGAEIVIISFPEEA